MFVCVCVWTVARLECKLLRAVPFFIWRAATAPFSLPSLPVRFVSVYLKRTRVSRGQNALYSDGRWKIRKLTKIQVNVKEGYEPVLKNGLWDEQLEWADGRAL